MVAEYVGELIRLPQVGRHVGRIHSPIAEPTVHSGRRRICTRRAVPFRLQVANLREWWHEACAREYYQFAIDDDFCVDATLKVTPWQHAAEMQRSRDSPGEEAPVSPATRPICAGSLKPH